MATYETQVEGLVQFDITASSNPTQNELTQFLTDGARDVINRVKLVNPTVIPLFTTVTSESGTGAIIDGEIFDVWGSDGTNDHPATLVPESVGKRSLDISSLLYRSKYNPCYYREGKKVFVKPNGGSVLHLHYPDVTYDAESILDFPKQYEHLVVLYASLQVMLSYMANLDNDLPTDVSLPPIPSIPTLSDNSVANLAAAPTYTQPVLSTSISDIETEIANDDTEMADIQRNKVSVQIDEYRARLENSLNTFNKNNAEYQAELQKKITDGQLGSKDDDQKIQKYGVEVQAFSADIQSLINNHNTKIQKLSTKYQWATARYGMLRQQYNEAIGLLSQPKQQQEGGDNNGK